MSVVASHHLGLSLQNTGVTWQVPGSAAHPQAGGVPHRTPAVGAHRQEQGSLLHCFAKQFCLVVFGRRRLFIYLSILYVNKCMGIRFFLGVKSHLLFSSWRAFNFSQNGLLYMLRARFLCIQV